MNLHRLFAQYCDEREAQAAVNARLEARIAGRLFSSRVRLLNALMVHMKKTILYGSLAGSAAALALLVAAPASFANAMEQVATQVRDGFHVLVSRPFDSNRDVLNDEQIQEFSQDPSVTSLDYTRDENGESFSMVRQCDTSEGPCEFQFADGGTLSVDSDTPGTIEEHISSEINVTDKNDNSTDLEESGTTLSVEAGADTETQVEISPGPPNEAK